MASIRHNITNAFAKSLAAPAKGQSIYWDEQPGLGVRITPNGVRSWIVQGYVNGKSKRFTLGYIEELNYKEARDEAGRIRIEMRKGIDPFAEKRERQNVSEAKSVTLEEIMEDYIAHKRSKGKPLRPASILGIKQCVGKEFGDWANSPVANITRDDVLSRFRELSKKAPTQANLVFRNLRALLNWAKEKYTDKNGKYTILNPNPVSQAIKANGLAQWNKETRRDSRIPEEHIGKVWLLLESCSDPATNIATTCVSADLIMFMLLTGTRIGEASQLTWDRVNLESDVPTFHLDTTKNHEEITLPINSLLRGLLNRRKKQQIANNPYVFPATRGKKGFLKDPRALFLKVSEIVGQHIHPHAMRRTFEEIAMICGVDSDRRRILLNHISGDVHALHYSNNKDPKVLIKEVEKVGKWVVEKSKLELAEIAGSNVAKIA